MIYYQYKGVVQMCRNIQIRCRNGKICNHASHRKNWWLICKNMRVDVHRCNEHWNRGKQAFPKEMLSQNLALQIFGLRFVFRTQSSEILISVTWCMLEFQIPSRSDSIYSSLSSLIPFLLSIYQTPLLYVLRDFWNDTYPQAYCYLSHSLWSYGPPDTL